MINSTASTWSVLALVRFILALTVVFGHLAYFQPLGSYPPLFSHNLGHSAVFGFFLISGFSISQSYRKKQEGFYERRALRIYPLYFFSVIFGTIVGLAFGPGIVLVDQTMVVGGWPMVIGNLAFMQGFFCRTLSTNIALWSLSIEVFLYLFTPLFHRMPKWSLYLLVAICLSCYLEWIPIPSPKYGFNVVIHAWAWILGFLIDRAGRGKERWILLGIGLGVGLLYLIHQKLLEFWIAMPYFLSLGCLIWINHGTISQKVRNLFNFLGDVSYPLYLFHMPVLVTLFVLFHLTGTLATVYISITVAVIAFLLVDVALKDLFAKAFSLSSGHVHKMVRVRRFW